MSAALNPTEMARVLPLLEKLLCQAGLMRATWTEHWQHSWQRATSYSVDWKHALLLTASLQVSTASPHLTAFLGPYSGTTSCTLRGWLCRLCGMGTFTVTYMVVPL